MAHATHFHSYLAGATHSSKMAGKRSAMVRWWTPTSRILTGPYRLRRALGLALCAVVVNRIGRTQMEYLRGFRRRFPALD
jgi:hypothetical protein